MGFSPIAKRLRYHQPFAVTFTGKHQGLSELPIRLSASTSTNP
jgi:hypothetical protein